MGTTAGELVAAGAAAVDSGDFAEAQRVLEEALDVADSPDARLLLGGLAFAVEDFDAAQDEWERAFRGYHDAEDLRGAARAATYLGMLYYDALGNESASRGWLSRAERLLDRTGRCVERGYLELALVACNVRDVSGLEESAAVALDLAIEFHDPDLESRALADSGLALISQGQLAKGFARLDEAMAPISAGEVSNPIISGSVFCALLTACERTGELRRAEQWTNACRDLVTRRIGDALPVIHAHCRLAYGTVLCDAGRWPEAEAELLEALGPSSTECIPKAADAAGALANLRLMQGRLDEAADLLAPYADRFEVCEPLARLHLLRGEHDLAAVVIDRALQDMVGDRLRAGRLLHLLVEVELARGDVDSADRSAERLSDYAAESDSSILRAEARLADGRVWMHRGDTAAAIEAFEAAHEALRGEIRPMLSATVQLELGRALAAAGEQARATEQLRAALACYDRLGLRSEVERAAQTLEQLGA